MDVSFSGWAQGCCLGLSQWIDGVSRRIAALMSYAKHKQMSGNRTVAIVIVALLHAAARLCDRDGPCLQCDQEGGRGPQDLRRRGGATVPRGTAASAAGPARVAAAGGRSAAAGPHQPRSAADGAGRSPTAPPPPITPTAPPAPPAPPARPPIVTKAAEREGQPPGPVQRRRLSAGCAAQ